MAKIFLLKDPMGGKECFNRKYYFYYKMLKHKKTLTSKYTNPLFEGKIYHISLKII